MPNYVTVLGVDPGIHNCGISFNKYDPKAETLIVADYFVIHAAEQAKKENRQESKNFGNVFSLITLEREFSKIIADYKPDFVACEDAFYSPRTPNAFVSLKLCIGSMQRVLYTEYHKEMYRIPPKLAKMVMSTATAGKVAIQQAIRDKPDIKIKDTKVRPLDEMVEHEADSIAIAYAFIKQIYPNLKHE